jgi:hypothetical protein
MPIRQQLFALTICVLVFVCTIDMVRRRRLREEYSALWLGTSLAMFVLVIRYDWLEALTRFIGAGLPTTTLFIGSTIFLMLIAVQFSLKITTLTNQLKNLAQESALQREELERLKGALGEQTAETEPADAATGTTARPAAPATPASAAPHAH